MSACIAFPHSAKNEKHAGRGRDTEVANRAVRELERERRSPREASAPHIVHGKSDRASVGVGGAYGATDGNGHKRDG